MNNRRDYLFDRIEDIACEATNKVMLSYAPNSTPVSNANLYKGRTNPPLLVSIARSYAYYAMHNLYGFTYEKISNRAQRSVISIMKATKRIREAIYFDPLLKDIHQYAIGKIKKDLL